MRTCYFCILARVGPLRQWGLDELIAHVRSHHPEMIGEGMPDCPNCGMPCEPGRHPQDGWMCHYCGLFADQRVCPTCRSTVHRSRLTGAAERAVQAGIVLPGPMEP